MNMIEILKGDLVERGRGVWMEKYGVPTLRIIFTLFDFVFLSGLLRYKVDFQGMEYDGMDDLEFFDEDDY